jgi:hypothetical protein
MQAIGSACYQQQQQARLISQVVRSSRGSSVSFTSKQPSKVDSIPLAAALFALLLFLCYCERDLHSVREICIQPVGATSKGIAAVCKTGYQAMQAAASTCMCVGFGFSVRIAHQHALAAGGLGCFPVPAPASLAAVGLSLGSQELHASCLTTQHCSLSALGLP